MTQRPPATARATSAASPDGLPDLGEDVEEDEAQEKRLHDGSDDELDLVLPQHHQVAQDQRPQRDAAGRRWPSGVGVVPMGEWLAGLGMVVVISRVAPCR